MKKYDDNTITHEELCAYVLGEAEPQVKSRVEAALESDEALRAERDTLAGTIGLVQSVCAKGEVLSPGLLATLEGAAQRAPRPSAWYLSTPVRMAAGVTALAAGVIAGRAMMQPAPLSSGSGYAVGLAGAAPAEGLPSEVTRLALLDEAVDEAQAARMRLDELDADTLHDKDSAVQVANGARIAEEVARVRHELAVTGSPLNSVEPEASIAFDSLQAIGYADAPDTVGSVLTVRQLGGIAAGGEGGEAVYGRPNSQPAGGAAAVGSRWGGFAGPGGPADPQAGGLARTAGDDFFLGQSPGVKVADSKNAAGEDLSRARKRAKKVNSPSGPASPGAGGPSTPGPVSSGSKSQGNTSGYLGVESRRLAIQPTDAGEVAGQDFTVDTYSGLELKLRFESADDREQGRGRYGYAGQRDLTPAQIDELCKLRVDRILQDCRRRPNERPRDMFFRYWGDNAFELARLDNLSTFGVDVDTASYALARRYLADGLLPEKAQVRTEEFVNYFDPDMPAPTEETFAVYTDLTTSRFGADATTGNQRYMLRVTLRGREVARSERKPLALTFVVDTSGSMKEGGRLELVKHALRLLSAQLDANDSLSIVAFSNEARLVLPMTSAASRGIIETAIFGLNPDGGTNAEAGLEMGYEVARSALSNEVHNRVVLLSDGVANIGQTDQDRINADVRARRESGIYLNTIGVGMNNHNDTFLEQLANKGDGLCNYIDSAVEARRALVENFTGAFEPIARDVKIQVEFDAGQVYRYRLLGYENRAIADADFRNDAVDAGEVGSGHQVVALYELELTGAQADAPLAEVRLRWKAPTGAGRDPLEDAATERSFPVSADSLSTWEGASAGYKRSTLVAQFAEILRRSVHARNDSLDELIAESQKLAPQLSDPDFEEFVAMLRKSRALIVEHLPRRDTLTLCIDSVRRNHILRAQYEELRQTENRQVIDELERQNQELEARIAELIRGELEQQVK